MKKLFFIFTMLAFVSACSDGDDKGNETPPDGGNTPILPKQIAKVVCYEGTENQNSYQVGEYQYSYDSQGRISQIVEYTNHKDTIVSVYTYSADKITMKTTKGTNREETYTLQNGRASYHKYSSADYEGDWDEYNFTYTDGYMSLVKGIIEADSHETETLSFRDGKLIRYTYADDNDSEYKGSIDFVYENQKNNMNIDLFAFIGTIYFDSNFESVLLLGVGGTRSSYLPESATFIDPEYGTGDEVIGAETSKIAFKYEVKDDYVIRMTTYDEDGQVDWKFEISYKN